MFSYFANACPQMETTSLAEFCSSPIWKSMGNCANDLGKILQRQKKVNNIKIHRFRYNHIINLDIYDALHHHQCNLTSFAHFVPLRKVCDGVYDCPDRSDESMCEERGKDGGSSYLEAISQPPKVSADIELCNPGDGGLGVMIGTKCLR